MIRHLLVLLLGFVSLAPQCLSQNTDNDSRLLDLISRYGEANVTIPYTDRKSADLLSRNVSILSVKEKEIHVGLSTLTVGWFILQKFDYKISERIDIKGIESALNLKQAMEWETYPTYSQYDSIMQSFQALYPSLCKLETIGTSINGKLVLALKISDNASVNDDEPEVFYSSTIHGNETGGFIIMLRLADYLLKNYNSDSRVKTLVDNLEIWINPLANPDGAYKSGNIISTLSSRYNANGFDLNRNFPDPVTPNTVKQKETIDMVNFLGKHRFVISANFHAGVEVVNYPWDRWFSKFHADDSWFYSISRSYADTAHVYSGPAYMNFLDNGVTRGAVWYVVYGGRQDYVTYGLQGREVTIELDDQYITPAAQLTLLWQNNWRSLLGYLENALYGIQGKVISATTSSPVAAKIFIAGHDTDSSHVYSDTLTGSFARLLSPGSWDLTFSARGYRDTTISNIVLLARNKIYLTVNLEPETSRIDTTFPVIPVLYPNPASGEIRVILSDQLTGQVNVRIYNQTGILCSDYNTFAEPEIPLQVDIRRLAAGAYNIIFTGKTTRFVSRGRFVVIK